MKISVLGAGAIGTMLGGLIKAGDPSIDVVLIARGQHGEVMRSSGRVKLLGPWPDRDIAITATEDMSAIAGSDHVLVTVKSGQTREAITAAAPFLGDAIVTSVQNGFNDAALEPFVAPERLVMGITATNVTIPAPGSASLQFNGTIVVGPRADRGNVDASRRAAECLRKTRFLVYENDNIEGVRYNKLAINSPGYAASLSKTNFIADGVCNTAWRRAVGLPLAQECVDVYAAAGVQLASIPKLPDINKLRNFFRLLDKPLLGSLVGMGARLIFNRRPIQFSLEQDLAKGKPHEALLTNGEIVRLANAHGQVAPLNQLVIDLADEVAARGPGKFFTREEVIERFRKLTQ